MLGVRRCHPSDKLSESGVSRIQTTGRGRNILRVNFRLLKKELEPMQIVFYLNDCSSFYNDLCKKTEEKKGRTERAETLIKGLYRLITDENEDKILQDFFKALDNSKQSDLSTQLVEQAETSPETIRMDENIILLQMFAETKEKIKKELEPRKVIDQMVDLQGLDFDEHDEILNETQRDVSVDLIFNTLDNRQGIEWKILRPLCDWFKKKYPEFTLKGKTEAPTSSTHVPSGVKVGYNFNEVVDEQDANEHTDPFSQLREIQQRAVRNMNGDPDRFGDAHQMLMDQCESSLKRISFSSINLHLQTTSDMSLKQLKECCNGGAAKQWLLSLLSRDDLDQLKKLKATTVTVNVSIYDLQREDIFKVFDEETDGCLCVISKECLNINLGLCTEAIGGLEIKIIDILFKNALLTVDMKRFLENLRADCQDSTYIKEQLIAFLCNQDLSQVAYCCIENEILKDQRRHFIRQLQQKDGLKSLNCKRRPCFSKTDIQEHKELLEDELDAHWFISCLKPRGDKDSKEIVETIEKSSSRRDRTRQFIEYLCKLEETETDWFADVLKKYNRHVLAVLLPESLENVSEIRHGLLSIYDFLTEELDPEDFSSTLRSSSQKKLECSQLVNLGSKRDRSVMFLSNLLKKENSDLISEVMNAMKTSSSAIYRAIQEVVEKGSLCEHYRCPRIEKERLKSAKGCFTTQISLTDDDEEAISSTLSSDKNTDDTDISPSGRNNTVEVPGISPSTITVVGSSSVCGQSPSLNGSSAPCTTTQETLCDSFDQNNSDTECGPIWKMPTETATSSEPLIPSDQKSDKTSITSGYGLFVEVPGKLPSTVTPKGSSNISCLNSSPSPDTTSRTASRGIHIDNFNSDGECIWKTPIETEASTDTSLQNFHTNIGQNASATARVSFPGPFHLPKVASRSPQSTHMLSSLRSSPDNTSLATYRYNCSKIQGNYATPESIELYTRKPNIISQNEIHLPSINNSGSSRCQSSYDSRSTWTFTKDSSSKPPYIPPLMSLTVTGIIEKTHLRLSSKAPMNNTGAERMIGNSQASTFDDRYRHERYFTVSDAGNGQPDNVFQGMYPNRPVIRPLLYDQPVRQSQTYRHYSRHDFESPLRYQKNPEPPFCFSDIDRQPWLPHNPFAGFGHGMKSPPLQCSEIPEPVRTHATQEHRCHYNCEFSKRSSRPPTRDWNRQIQ